MLDLMAIYKSLLQANPGHFRRQGCTYFIQDVTSRKIKIGQTFSIAKRFSTLRGANAGELKLLAVISGRHVEKDLHARFSKYRSHGEWFEENPELQAYIESVQKKLKGPLLTLSSPARIQERPFSDYGL